ncbi:hypothetical protein BDN67DRAFT_210660 [Paxillus ammoniavirescens]|nr:hypothetical protein BDN67DRAFT_210660 [Paxillus ammoniavirescens]
MGGEQKYVDLLFRACRKFPSWDPEVIVEVGDWGRLTTGRPRWAFWRPKRCIFVKEGNIYQDKIAEKYGIPQPTVMGEEGSDGLTWFKSHSTRDMDAATSAERQTPALAECAVKAGFQFTASGGAVLVMANDCLTTVHPASSLRRLLEVDGLRGRVLVSEVHRCASYARYMAPPRTSSVVIGLTAPPPSGDPSAQENSAWVLSTNKGELNCKVDSSGDRKFCPLYRLASLTEAEQGTGQRSSVDDETPLPLPDALPPWMASSP